MQLQTDLDYANFVGNLRQEIGISEYINGWTIDRIRGVYRQNNDKVVVASPIPLFVTKILKSIENGNEKIELTFFKRGKWYAIVVDRQIVASNQQILKLANQGLEVNSNNAKALVTYIADFVSELMYSIPFAESKASMGWDEGFNSFMPYTGNYVFDGENTFGTMFQDICSTKGDLKTWCEHMQEIRKNIYVRLLMDASFSSPLIELVGENPFVFLLHGGTASGKTVALMCAASIWGNPDRGHFTQTMNMTTNAMLSRSAFLKNIAFCADELQDIKSRWANFDQLVMCVTEGIDRARLNLNGDNGVKSWACAFLFTGEETMTKANSGGGVKNRVIEVQLEGKRIIEDGHYTSNLVRDNYGFAGREYVQHLGNREQIIENYRKLKESFLNSFDTTDKQAGAFALIILADTIVGQLFFHEEKPIQMNDISEFFKSEEEVSTAYRARDFIINTISQKGTNFTSEAREFWGKTEQGGDIVYFNKTLLDKVLTENGFDFDAVKKEWKRMGFIETNSQGRYVFSTTIYGHKAQCVKLNIGGEENNE